MSARKEFVNVCSRIDFLTPSVSILFWIAGAITSTYATPAKPVEFNVAVQPAPTDAYSYNWVIGVWWFVMGRELAHAVFTYMDTKCPRKPAVVPEPQVPAEVNIDGVVPNATPVEPEASAPKQAAVMFANDLTVVLMQLSAVAIVIGLTEILKVCFGGPRAYFDPNSTTNTKDSQMGMPSGHSSTSAAIAVVTFLSVTYRYPLTVDLTGCKLFKRNLICLFTLGLCLAFPLGTAVSRVRHFHHTFVQVDFGLVLGTILASVVCFAFFLPRLHQKQVCIPVHIIPLRRVVVQRDNIS